MQKRLLSLGQWLAAGLVIGLLAGTASALFLTLLFKATVLRLADPRWVWGLPLAGLAMGWVYERFGREVLPGNNLVLDRIHGGGPQLPRRMAPLVLLGTVWTHLFGGSAGREGTGVQMGASLADGVAHLLKINPVMRRHMIAAGVAAGFASVFGTPLAGLFFGLEVVSVGKLDYEALVPAMVAALVGDWCTRAWGLQHAAFPTLAAVELDGGLALAWILFAVCIATAAYVFIELTHRLKTWNHKHLPFLPTRLFVGGAIVALLGQLPGMLDYLGLSTHLISEALGATPPPAWGFAAKLLITAITLGFGFIGGEVTPLFVIGACLGSAFAGLVGVPGPLAAGIGLAAMFGAAANTPLAMTVMAVELMGAAIFPHAALVCVVAYLLTGQRGIYTSQGWHRPKHFLVPDALVPDPDAVPEPAAVKKRAKPRSRR